MGILLKEIESLDESKKFECKQITDLEPLILEEVKYTKSRLRNYISLTKSIVTEAICVNPFTGDVKESEPVRFTHSFQIAELLRKNDIRSLFQKILEKIKEFEEFIFVALQRNNMKLYKRLRKIGVKVVESDIPIMYLYYNNIAIKCVGNTVVLTIGLFLFI